MLLAERPCIAALQERRQLDLVYVRHVLRAAEQLLEVRDEVVADADRAGAAVVEQFLERAPRVAPLAGDGPVDEIEIDIVEPESLLAGIECAQRGVVAVIVIP